MQLLAPNLLRREDHSRLSCHHVCKRPSGCLDASCHETLLKDGFLSDSNLSELHFKSIAPTLQDDFALPRCLNCLEITLRFHGQDAPWASLIANEPSNQAAMWSSWYCAKVKSYLCERHVHVKTDRCPCCMHDGCFEHLPRSTFKQSQGSANELIDHPEATRDASCNPILMSRNQFMIPTNS